jgi:hypothetical protein
MRRSLSRTPRRDYPEGVRLVHNFYPGPLDDPGRDRMVGLDGFRIWIIDEPNGTSGTSAAATAAGSTAGSTTEPGGPSTRTGRRREC